MTRKAISLMTCDPVQVRIELDAVEYLDLVIHERNVA
jgi:hypothetical protein